MKAKTAAPYRYPGWLGKPANQADLIRSASASAKGFTAAKPSWTDAEFNAAWEAGYNEAMLEHGYKVLIELQRHFKLDPHDPDSLKALAWKLAAVHVPANQFVTPAKPGRPRKARAGINALARIAPATLPKRNPGAPQVWDESDYRRLLRFVEAGKEKLRKLGKKATNVGALEAVYVEFVDARKNGLASKSEARSLAKVHARRVSDARKALRKPK
jgi:hypothetical protein